MSGLKSIKKPAVKRTQLFINNEWVNAVGGKTFESINPATEDVICSVQEGGKADVDLAVSAARLAMKRNSPWRTMAPAERGLLLMKMADIIERDIEYIASLEVVDNGKPFTSAVGDIRAGIKCLTYYGGYCDKIEGKTLAMENGKMGYTRYEPVGVVGAITPWNFPFMLSCFKLAHVLGAGNSIVLKPPEQTPLTSLLLGDIAIEAGIPAGVINIITGFGPTAGAAISEHPDINKVTFTGSTEVGHLIQKASGDTNLKRVTLELGGKSALIVGKSADLSMVVPLAQDACYVNMGQTCCALTRTYVHEDIYDEFVKQSAELAKKTRAKVGDPFADDIRYGPQVDKIQFEKILDFIDSGKKEGAKLECGGGRLTEKGYFVEPTVFSNVKDDMRIAKEEIFGPVQQIMKFSNIEEAIDRANDSEYGLAAAVFTNDLSEALYVSNSLESGQVWVNSFMSGGANTPFGGYKKSGIGREFGWDGLLPYMEIKTVVIKM
ncbi:aldehyde dehydrogenase X, mitochondrial-like [Symsagittifera roscoffensis]|uniref:aldehyde dehydrogenase X, mitochondrial-like n=1 Tax=Symsagittifera roscoffensis TaxID=84072 RepID=UPI00307B30E7